MSSVGISQCVSFPSHLHFFRVLILHVVEEDSFWDRAFMLFDPQEVLDTTRLAEFNAHENGSSATAKLHMSPYLHFRHVTSISCVICRLASPYTNIGLASAIGLCYGMHTGPMHTCKEHSDKYCGVCMYGQIPANGHFTEPNNDESSFPHVEAVCHCCREDRVLSVIADIPDEYEKMQQVQSDLQVEIAVAHYVADGEGTMELLLDIMRERIWLTRSTRITDLTNQALAASRYDAEGIESDTEMDFSESDEEYLEDGHEERLRATALDDWARHRILGGHWISPADVWYNHKPLSYLSVSTPPASHPCLWVLDDYDNGPRPTAALLNSGVPPSYALCEQAFFAHGRVMRTILFPAMHNVVRKIVISCGVTGKDPAIIAARMTLEDVLKELQDEMAWYEGVDWLERWKNDNRDAMVIDDNSYFSSTTLPKSEIATKSLPITASLQFSPSHIARSHATLPFLLDALKEPTNISVTPNLSPPRLIHDIPFIPTTTAHFPQYTYESVRAVWREACSPLYQCHCSTCKRAASQTKNTHRSDKGPAVDPGSLEIAIKLDEQFLEDKDLAQILALSDGGDIDAVKTRDEVEQNSMTDAFGVVDSILPPHMDRSTKKRPHELEDETDDSSVASYEDVLETQKRPRHV